MLNLAEQLKKLNLIVRNSSNNDEIIENIFKHLEETLDVNSIIVDDKGVVLYEISNKLVSISLNKNLDFYNVNDSFNSHKIEDSLTFQLNNLMDNKLNIKLSNLESSIIDKHVFSNVFGTFIPIFADKTRIATFIFYREGEKFDDTIHIINEFLSNLVGIALINNIKNNREEYDRSMIAVKSAIDTLSFTELEAVISIFSEFNKDEGVIIASKVADNYGITRSVIVNALRKVESAGIIETRSLGMKGTYIKVLNKYLYSELNKFEKSKK
ncbi:MAG: hypothetical protein R3Y29_04245 [bacterium]